MIKTGIFGGAFNPVHNGHVNLAKEAIEQLKLRKLLVMPREKARASAIRKR